MLHFNVTEGGEEQVRIRPFPCLLGVLIAASYLTAVHAFSPFLPQSAWRHIFYDPSQRKAEERFLS